ncbi:polysaccharide deacetylase family protein [Glycomyces arizonensis]|uniref:polysaccharide deacetylase family protein n=1 Tax=Glycomyces arizonensis TaxID=256035 RepID=UPI0004220EE7|nr:polysaccharide deacetylase family protein [Glycomyces arizonensis]
MSGIRRRRPLITVLAAVIATLGAAMAFTLPQTAANAAACNGYVALTYDDGPNPNTTQRLIGALQAAGARATFFNIGQNAQNYPSLVRAQQNAGMWTGNHSWTHPHMTQMSSAQMASEISRTQQAVQQAIGTAPNLFRPPYGETNATLRSVEAQYGLTEVIWDVDSRDWAGASTAQIVQAARGLQNGGVILMHDNYQTTIDAVPQIVADLASRGLCPGMISPATGRAVAPDGGGNNQTDPPTTDEPDDPTTPPDDDDDTTPPPTGDGDCTAVVDVVNDWGSGWQGNVMITGGGNGVNGWTLTWTWPSGQSINSSWNADVSSSGSSVTASDVGWNAGIAAGQTVNAWGFVASGSSTSPQVTCTAT